MKRLAALLLLPSACGNPQAGERIDCAVDGAADFSRVCTVERAPNGTLTVRGPSGSFRRLATSSGSIVAADGAEPATVEESADGLVEVAVGGDRYRLRPPAR